MTLLIEPEFTTTRLRSEQVRAIVLMRAAGFAVDTICALLHLSPATYYRRLPAVEAQERRLRDLRVVRP